MRLLLFTIIFISSTALAGESLITIGGPSLINSEKYRYKKDRHDYYWGNFVDAAKLQTKVLRSKKASQNVTWLVYKPSYEMRGKEAGIDFVSKIASSARSLKVTLIWFDNKYQFSSAFNAFPSRGIDTFDYFGHSDQHAFLFDYSTTVMMGSSCWFHTSDFKLLSSNRIKPDTKSTSWGCYTAKKMSYSWNTHFNNKLIGAYGKTNYVKISQGKLPFCNDGWN